MPDPTARLGAVRYAELPPNRIAYRRLGAGAPVLFVHGYPLSGATWRHVAPALSESYDCVLPDLPGAGLTAWSEATDFTFAGQAETLRGLLAHLGLASVHVVAHDTGATIGRQLALIAPERVASLLLIGTEIPHHRPPFIERYQAISDPRRTLPLRTALRSPRFLRSRAGFGGALHDPAFITGEFREVHVRPVVADARRAEGQVRYLRGIDFALVDGLRERHAEITAPSLLVWGEEDRTFPVGEARVMVDQLGNCEGLVTVAGASTFVQEEQPAEIVRISREFLGRHALATRATTEAPQ